jgi:signal transduction histidine kinase
MQIRMNTELALRERVKELTCLYGIAQLSGHPETPVEEVLRGVVGLLPPAWQYPEVADARILLDGRAYSTAGAVRDSDPALRSPLVINDRERGWVQVSYRQARPPADEGPFLKEERNLIDTISRHVSVVIERREASREKTRLQEQLLHADRLATIGQLAAGVAHELNEPLGNMLGFAQLAARQPGVTEGLKRDLDKIVSGCLQSRRIIRKLMTFARQNLPEKQISNLNRLISDGLALFESRCASSGIRLLRELGASVPAVAVDPSQINQVLVNLVVNAIQAMPGGGRLTVGTRAVDSAAEMRVTDTGSGMSEEVAKKVFLPFFTTKDVDEGTGLGLSVVHGIVTAHEGSIEVTSREGKGTTFTVRLPAAPRPEAG